MKSIDPENPDLPRLDIRRGLSRLDTRRESDNGGIGQLARDIMGLRGTMCSLTNKFLPYPKFIY